MQWCLMQWSRPLATRFADLTTKAGIRGDREGRAGPRPAEITVKDTIEIS
jgi:hypothetical protein